MIIEDENNTFYIRFNSDIDDTIMAHEKILLLQFLPELYIETLKELNNEE